MLRSALCIIVLVLGSAALPAVALAADAFTADGLVVDGRIDRLVRDLGAADVATRERAQGELSLLLVRGGTASDLAEALERAVPEARRRVTVSIGADDRLLGLAVRLAASGDEAVARVGRAAIESQLTRWSLSAFDEPSTAVYDKDRQERELPDSWRNRVAFRISVDPNAGGAVAAFDRFDRLGLGPAPVVLDPMVAERMIRRPSPAVRARRVDGSWTEVLQVLCEVHDAAYQVQGYRYPGERRASDAVAAEGDDDILFPRPWIHVVARGTTERAHLGRDLRRRGGSFVVDWCLTAQREGNLVRQSAAARALAAIDWPAAIAWFERKWLASGDVVALEGLMASAARGRVAPALQQSASVRKVLDLVDREAREVEELQRALSEALAPETVYAARQAYEEAVREVDERARRLADGLAGLAPIASGAGPNAPGTPLLPVFLEGFESAPPNGRWVRLVAMEGLGLTSRRAVDAAARVLRGELQARSRRQALRTMLVALPLRRDTAAAPPAVLSDPLALFRELPSGDVAGLGLELGLAGIRVAGNDARWVRGLLTDVEAVTELIVWGALLSEQSVSGLPSGSGGAKAAPAWLVEAVRAGVRMERDRSPASGPGPFARATAFARGDLAKSLWSLVLWVRPALDARRVGDLQRAALRAGFASPATRRAALDGAKVALERDRDDPRAVEDAWLDLAALAGDDALGEFALSVLRASLLESLRQRSRGPAGTSNALMEATEVAIASMERARRDDLSEQFSGELRRAATQSGHPLADRFLSVDWPPRRPLPPRDLERLAPLLPPRR
ncbi:MAG: hypothetical protein AAF957_21595 [Planctomycetota bacterium]